MLSITENHLSMASKILMSRLTRPSAIDTIIVAAHLINPSYKLENYCNRFIGCFDLRPDNNVCFYLAARYHPDERITHLFVYYLNCDYDRIQEAEIEALKPYLPNIGDSDSDLKVGIIIVRCTSHPSTYLSTLIEAIDFTIGPQLISNFVPLQIINTDVRDLAIGPHNDIVTNCDGILSAEAVSKFQMIAEDHKVELSIDDESARLSNPEVILLRTNGHLMGIICSEEAKLANYILMHKNQFENIEHYARIKRLISNWMNMPLHHCCSRFFGNNTLNCSDKLVQYSLFMALEFRPHVLTVIRENELRYLFEGKNVLAQNTPNFERIVPNSSCNIDNRSRSVTPALESASQIQLIFNSQRHYPQALIGSFDSQGTEIVEPYDWKNDILTWREVSKERRRIKDSIVPPVHIIEPFTDFTQSYLVFMPCYNNAVRLMGQIWDRYAKTVVFPKIIASADKGEISKEGAHFLIYPVEDLSGAECLLIVDEVKSEWIFLKPGNEEHKDATYFAEVTRKYLMSLFNELESYQYRAVPITSTFHRGYSKVHLLMSLYVISRLFQYSVSLPQKVIYGEWELRRYASNICAELQYNNSEYNMENNLIDDRGRLKEGAKESYPSPLVCDTCVVPKDQCMFCKKRGFKNLGRHLSMKHGGQAHFANTSRLEFD